MTRVSLFDNGTHFATFDMPVPPRVGDTVEIAMPEDAHAKSFTVERIAHRMVYLPDHLEKLKQPDESPWRWEFRAHGVLSDPHDDDPNFERPLCSCAQGVTWCPAHGNQPAERDLCPVCKTAVLGYCAEGVYCTDGSCPYVA